MKVRSALIEDASGKLDGTIWARNASGLYIRSLVTLPDFTTTARTFMRDAMAEVVSRWKTELAPEQRAEWEAFARANPSSTRLGVVQAKGGMDEYIHANILRQWIIAQGGGFNLELIDTPPDARGCPCEPPTVQVASGTTDTLQLTWNGNEAWQGGASGGIVWISLDKVSPTRNFYARGYTYWAFLGNSDGVTNPPYVQALPYDLIGGYRCFWRFRGLTTDGRLSPEARGFAAPA